MVDFSKAFKNITKDDVSNLTVKIGHPPKLHASKCFCMWSDLLGFSNMFTSTNWDLEEAQMEAIYNRLESAHSSVLFYSSPTERNLILNDGIAKVFHPLPKHVDPNNIMSISMFLRTCVELHMSINETEYENKYPGCRSVIAFGDNINYLADEVRLDDYVLNYTKPKDSDISDYARKNNNPVIIYNPKELQMNTAFSKAYIIESGGSKAGLPGNYMYIDDSVIQAIDNYAKDKGYHPVWIEDEDGLKYFVPRRKGEFSDVVLGFCFDLIRITPTNISYNTTVYKLLRFYPWDERTDEFFFDVNKPLMG